jgi:hypothetical protein
MEIKRAVIVLIAFSFVCSARAVTPGQIDNFEDGTPQNWTNGGAPGAPPVLNIDTGGPGGAGDHFIQVTSVGGGGAGNRLTALNRNQWLGDYVNQGITAIEMDLNNFGDVQLSIRIAFKQELGPLAPGYVSQPFILPAGSGWQHFVFSIDMVTMIAINNPAPFNTFFSGNFEEVRIINSITPNLNGDPIAAQLGIDNIHAVPEPRSFLLAATGLLAIAAARWCKRRANS